MRRMAVVLGVLAVLAVGGRAANERFYVVPVDRLEITRGELPRRTSWRVFRGRYRIRSVLEAAGEAYVEPARDFASEGVLAVRTGEDLPVSGRFFFPPGPREEAGTVVGFRIPVGVENVAEPKQRFREIKRQHYRSLLREDIPGAAWFRHRAEVAGGRDPGRRPSRGELRETYSLFTGGRAVSENLQLDRVLRPGNAVQQPEIPVDELEGISVAEMEWEELIEGAEPRKDPLARLIPADQHALFFSSFSDMLKLMDEAEANGTPVLRLLEPRSETARSRARYERQLCLRTGLMSRILGPQLVRSVAFTGADPYLRTGADVAVLFEAREPAALHNAIRARQTVAAAQPNVSAVKQDVGGVECVGVRSPDRSVCSYLARIGDSVVVTNSPAQLRRIIETAGGKREALASLPEYTFFRSRYERGSEEETGFLIVTDATIRRWCSARWRIGASRRTRMASLMAARQARHLRRVADGEGEKTLTPNTAPVPHPGEIRLGSGGVRSSRYGTPEFLTPILELDIEKATPAEAGAYRGWRRAYQRNFRQFFDPIAVRFSVRPESVGIDLTVMPIIEGSDYREWVDLMAGGSIGPGDGDPHEGALVHFAMSVDRKAEQIREIGEFGPLQNPKFGTSPLSWLGETVAVYAEKDPFWGELRESEEGGDFDFMESNFHRLPVLLHVGVSSPLKLTAFLASIKSVVDMSAPGMTVWETHEHNGRSYVSVGPSEAAKREMPSSAPEDFALHYAPSGSALLLTLNEKLLHQALDRQAKRTKSSEEEKASDEPEGEWLGRNLCLRADKDVLKLVEPLNLGSYQRAMQDRAWGNLPILNEWRRLFPERDPVQVHQKLWHTRLLCPGGGRYVWNEQWRTMESTVYGHPARPQSGPPLPPQIEGLENGNFGLTFEHNGLRARVRLERSAPDEE